MQTCSRNTFTDPMIPMEHKSRHKVKRRDINGKQKTRNRKLQYPDKRSPMTSSVICIHNIVLGTNSIHKIM